MDKNYDKYVVDAEATSLGNGGTFTGPEIGQVKYAKRAGAVSIYKDETRNSANDNLASAKAEGSMACDYNASYSDESAEESQGI